MGPFLQRVAVVISSPSSSIPYHNTKSYYFSNTHSPSPYWSTSKVVLFWYPLPQFYPHTFTNSFSLNLITCHNYLSIPCFTPSTTGQSNPFTFTPLPHICFHYFLHPILKHHMHLLCNSFPLHIFLISVLHSISMSSDAYKRVDRILPSLVSSRMQVYLSVAE